MIRFFLTVILWVIASSSICQDIRKEYYEDGSLKSVERFKGVYRHGKSVFFHKNGKPGSKNIYRKGVKVRKSRTYFESGQIRILSSYKNGKRHGIAKIYNKRGVLLSRQDYKNDSRKGVFKTYRENGKLKSKGRYLEGKEFGTWKYYYENGNLQSLNVYKSSSEIVLAIFYYENKSTKAIGSFDERIEPRKGIGRRVGKWKFYHSNGQLNIVHFYDNGKLMGISENYSENGIIRDGGTIEKGNGTVIFYNSKGEIEKIVEYNNGIEKMNDGNKR